MSEVTSYDLGSTDAYRPSLHTSCTVARTSDGYSHFRTVEAGSDHTHDYDVHIRRPFLNTNNDVFKWVDGDKVMHQPYHCYSGMARKIRTAFSAVDEKTLRDAPHFVDATVHRIEQMFIWQDAAAEQGSNLDDAISMDREFINATLDRLNLTACAQANSGVPTSSLLGNLWTGDAGILGGGNPSEEFYAGFDMSDEQKEERGERINALKQWVANAVSDIKNRRTDSIAGYPDSLPDAPSNWTAEIRRDGIGPELESIKCDVGPFPRSESAYISETD